MKTSKKLLALLMTVIMVFAVGVTALGADYTGTGATTDGQIKITNASVGQTYKIYKIFDATVSEDGKIAYTYNGTLEENDFFAQDATTGAITYLGEGDELSEGAIEFLADLKGSALMTQEAESATITFDKIPYGYYYVESTLGSAVSVDSTNPTVELMDKNETFPKNVKKTSNKTSVQIGDVVDYEVSFDAANYNFPEGSSEPTPIYQYIVKDEPTYLNIDKTTVVLYVGSTKITDTSKYSVEQDNDGNLTVVVKWATKNDDGSYSFLYDANVNVKVQYKATVLAGAADAGVVVNEAAVSFNDDDNPVTPEPPQLEIPTFSISIDKFDIEDDSVKLQGAKFVLKNSDGKFYQWTQDSKVAWVDSQSNATPAITNDSGAAYFKGLAEGEYTLVEIEPPKGYNLPSDSSFSMEITVTENDDEIVYQYSFDDGDAVDMTENDNYTATAAIGNGSGIELPTTGGKGTMLFIVIGVLFAMSAAVVLVTKKRLYNEGC